MSCPKCQSESVAVVPAEIRFYRNRPRTLSHPPMTPAPDIQVCLDCGYSEFSVPSSWLSAGWLNSAPNPSTSNVAVTAGTLAASAS